MEHTTEKPSKSDSLNDNLAMVAIGRNEGDRLKRGLNSLKSQGDRVVYIDSGSTDGSVEFAISLGVEVVNLDMTIPFTAARARHEGFLRAIEKWPDTEFIQFVDGDCEVVDTWIDSGMEAILASPSLGIVTGWRSERFPNASEFNKMCDIEWHQPVGNIDACGGDMLVRVDAYQKAGGFDAEVIAAEDDEFCIRVRNADFRIERLREPMTLHDASMFRFAEWWQRARRAGHGFAQVGDLHNTYFVNERMRVLLWGGIIPVVTIVLMMINPIFILLAIGAYLYSFVKSKKGLMASGYGSPDAIMYARYLTISKFPNLIGMLTYWFRKITGRAFKIIEYK